MSLMDVAAWAPGETMPGSTTTPSRSASSTTIEFTAERRPTCWLRRDRAPVDRAGRRRQRGVDGRGRLRPAAARGRLTRRGAALYREAGHQPRQDLQTLTRNANIAPTRARSAGWSARRCRRPPPSARARPAHDLRPARAGAAGELLRALVRRAGDRPASPGVRRRQEHCNFTPGELVAGVLALQQRVETGQWGSVAGPDQLQASATQQGLAGGAAFVPFWPEPLSATTGRSTRSPTARALGGDSLARIDHHRVG